MKKRTAIFITLMILLCSGVIFALPIHEAAKNGDLQKVKKLLEDDPIMLKVRDEAYRRTPLHWAAVGGHKDVVEYLVCQGANIESRDTYNLTPYMCAKNNAHTDVADFLRKQGAKMPEDKHIHVQGTEQSVPGIYFTGNPPTPPKDIYRAAYISAAVLLLIAALLQWLLKRRFLEEKGVKADENESANGRKTGYKTFLITFTVVIFYFIAWEAFLQFYVARNPYSKFIPDPVSHWKINPKLVKALSKDSNSEEKCPLNGEILDVEYPVHKDKGTYRILCYGDSQTNGLPWAKVMSNTYPKQFQQRLWDEFPQKKIQVMNMGVAGYTSYQGLIFHKNVGSCFNPDCIILAFGYHDGNIAYSQDRDVSSDNPMLIRTRRILYRSQLYLLIRKKILERKAYKIEDNGEPIYRRVSLEDYRNNLKEFVELGKKNGHKTVFMILPQQYQPNVRHPKYADAMREAAKENNVPLIDCAKTVKDIPLKDQSAWFMEDKCHMTVEGNGKIAEIMCENLKPMLKKEFEAE